MVRSMIGQIDLPPSFWGHALETVAFTLNRVPSKTIEKTPYEIWTGKKPSLSFLKIWGCEVYVKHQASDKLSSRSSKCLFVGYPKETKGYYVYNPTDHKMFVIRNGVLLEKEFISKRTSGSKVNLEEVRESQDNVEPQMETEKTHNKLLSLLT
ncbi:hypothetical protein K1719_036329 [Acacia pycnantha]|nr:hypothetical protein K1719_036329 [Acacia pycnantha]